MKRIKNSFYLPIETAVLVPSTTKGDKKISVREFKKRIDEVRLYLSKKFGGYTSVTGIGGYVSKKKGLIKEDVVLVVSYAQKKDFKKHKRSFINQVKKWGKKYKQESMGVIIENDLYYINT